MKIKSNSQRDTLEEKKKDTNRRSHKISPSRKIIPYLKSPQNTSWVLTGSLIEDSSDDPDSPHQAEPRGPQNYSFSSAHIYTWS